MKFRKTLLSLGFAVAGLACGKSPPSQPAAGPAPKVDPSQLRLSIMERLQHEATTRTPARPNAEAVAAALASRGMPLQGWKQVLASPLGARFCMAGQTAQGNAVAVCEFATAAQAESGLRYSHATFDPVIPNRRLIRREKTVLTISPAGGRTGNRGDTGDNDEVKAASAIFAAL